MIAFPKPRPKLLDKRKAAAAKLTAWRDVRGLVLARDKVCRVCQGKPYDVHHILPRSRGGRDVKTNLVAVCRNCHALIHGHVIKVSCRDEANRAGTVKFEVTR